MHLHRATDPAELAAAREVLVRSMADDQGYGYRPDWHWDLDHLQEVYVDNARQALFVAVEGGEVLGTCAVRVGGPASPPHPPEVAARYADRQAVAQITRLVTVPAARRRGLARQLVAAGVEFAREAGFRVACLHTNARTTGALEFWRQAGAVEVFDAREWEDDDRFETVHFEFPLR